MSVETSLKSDTHTFEDLLKVMDESGRKYELFDGQIVSMSGGTAAHSRVSFLLQKALDKALKEKSCRVFNSDMALRIQSGIKETYYFPDAMVKCGKLDLTKRYVENPCIVAEVLSKTTVGIDRVKKFRDYLNIDHLKAYLIVQAERPEIEYWKMVEGEPTVVVFGSGEFVEIDKTLRFPVDSVFEGI